MRIVKRLVLIGFMLAMLCLKPVTDRMPEPLKTAFSNVRDNALIVASGEGIRAPDLSLPRGAWETKPSGGVENVGGR